MKARIDAEVKRLKSGVFAVRCSGTWLPHGYGTDFDEVAVRTEDYADSCGRKYVYTGRNISLPSSGKPFIVLVTSERDLRMFLGAIVFYNIVGGGIPIGTILVGANEAARVFVDAEIGRVHA